MEEYNRITYDDNWQSVSEPEAAVVTMPQEGGEDGDQPLQRQRRSFPRQPVLTLQLVLCVLLGLAAFVFRSVGGETYDAAHAWYASKLSDTAIFDRLRSFDAAKLIATADEIPH